MKPDTLISAEIAKITSITTDKSMNITNTSDEIFRQILPASFGDTNKLDEYFLNEEEKIEFVRHYTGLISRLSYVKLLKQQWDYFTD